MEKIALLLLYLRLLHIFFLQINVAAAIATPEWNCSVDANVGSYQRLSNCTITGDNHVNVTGALEITGDSRAIVNNGIHVTISFTITMQFHCGPQSRVALRSN
jgi:hypothetical protein